MIQIGAPASTIDTPIEHLQACHRRIEQRLDTLVNAAGHLENNRPTALEAIRKSLHFLDTNGVLHTRDEEDSLFPRLRQKLAAADLAFLDSLEAQHSEADAIYSGLKQLLAEMHASGDYSAGQMQRYREAAERLRSLYREHIRAEDEVLMGMAKRNLSTAETSEMSREMRARRA